jgi:Undecaprenyl-phosphate glucose phosphotransferase
MSTTADSIRSKRVFSNSEPNIHLSRSIVTGLVILLDIAIITGIGAMFFLLYLGMNSEYLSRYAAVIALYTIFTLQVFNNTGLYRFNHILQPRQASRKIPLICGFIFLTLISVGFALKVSADYSRVWMFAWVVTSTMLLWAARFAVQGTVRNAARSGKISRNIIIYGGGEHGEKLIKHIEGLNEPWNRVVGVFDDRKSRISDPVGGYPVLGNLEDLLDFGRINRSDEILIALPWNSHERVLKIARILTALPSNIRLSSEFLGQDLLHQQITYKFGVPMLNIFERPLTGWAGFSKKIIDYILATIFALVAAPIMLLIATLIKLESRGPVFFKQKRYGFNNQLIEVYKFRSMYTDQADAHAEQLTTRNDPRVTRVGAFLRRTSLDELPQLLNVLKGEMSVVGPRPHAMRAKAAGKLYEDVVDGYAVRHKVKPGITGWAQVNGWRGNTDTERDITGRLEHDFYYIDNWSIMFDLYIILRTIKVVVSGDNAY